MPATAIPLLDRGPELFRDVVFEDLSDVLGQRVHLLVRVGGSSGRWRSVWRTTPAWVETRKRTSGPAPMIISVEPPPMSSTSVGVVSAGSRSLVAPR